MSIIKYFLLCIKHFRDTPHITLIDGKQLLWFGEKYYELDGTEFVNAIKEE